ncbi:hypothetical protein [Pseudomonas sp. NPDC089401]|uniref:hypothetical protein n=1 Tax=Pseudomonas sp. NPDC089401 TaxID=3364462 RepID=UPI0037FFA632
MPNHEAKLQHLSPEQLEALYREYLKGEKIALLLQRYNLDIAPGSLIKALPPVPCAGLTCPYCKTSLYQRPKCRTAQSSKELLAFCKTCDHRHYFASPSNWRCECTCRPCQASRTRVHQEQAVEQRKRVREHWSITRKNPISLQSLSITHRLQMMAMLQVRMDVRHNCLGAADHAVGDLRVSPSQAMDSTILQALHEKQLLLVDPESPLEAFSRDQPPKAWQSKVRWLSNVSLDGQRRASPAQLYRALHSSLLEGPRRHWHDEIIDCVQALCVEELCTYLAAQCAAHGLPWESARRASEAAARLLQVHSVQRACCLADAALQGALTFIARHQVSKAHAASTIAGCMLALSEQAVREQWLLTPPQNAPRGARSSLNQALFGVLLKQTDHGLEQPPAAYTALLAGRADP